MVLAAFVLGALTVATPWYVDGDEPCPGLGSDAEPFCGVQEAFDTAELLPGDEILVRDAVDSYGSGEISHVDGQSDAPIVLRPDDGHAPVMAGRIRIQDSSYWTVRGLTFDGSGVSDREAVLFYANDPMVGNIIEDNVVLDWGGTLQSEGQSSSAGRLTAFGAGSELIVSGAIIRNNRIVGGRGRGIRTHNTVGAIVSGNEVLDTLCQRDNDSPGMFPIHIRFSNDAQVFGNRIENIDVAPCHEDVGGELVRATGILLRSSDGVEVHHNFIRGVGGGTGGEGLGINLMHGADDCSIHHNIIVDADHCGICGGVQVSNGGFRPRIVNNTIIGGADHGIYVNDPVNALIQGNLIAGARDSQIRIRLVDSDPPDPPAKPDQYSWTIDNNLYFPPRDAVVGQTGFSQRHDLEGWSDACDCDAAAVADDPALPSAAEDFTVAAQSPAVDLAGEAPEIPGFNGRAPDVGALEAPLPVAAMVPVDDPDRIELTLVNQGPAPLQLDATCEGFELTLNESVQPLQSCETAGDEAIILRLTEPAYGGDTLSLRYDGTSVRDSSRVGGTIDSVMQPFVLDVANNSEEVPPSTTDGGDDGVDDGGTTGPGPQDGDDGAGSTRGPGSDGTAGDGDPGTSDFPEADSCTCRQSSVAPPWFLLVLGFGLRRRSQKRNERPESASGVARRTTA